MTHRPVASVRDRRIEVVGLQDSDRLPRRRTAPMPGTRRRWSSSRHRRAARSAWAIPTPTRRPRDLIHDLLAEVVRAATRWPCPARWTAMVAAIRNLGRPGIASMAICGRRRGALGPEGALARSCPWSRCWARAAIACRSTAAAGSPRTRSSSCSEQLGGWVAQGIPRVKMKIGRRSGARTSSACGPPARRSGPDVELFVDANGAYGRKQALALAERFAELGVTWFEEPVSSDDLEGLRLLRDRRRPAWTSRPASTATTCCYFRRMLEAGAVDVLQADAHALRRDHRLSAGGGALRGARRCRSRPTAPRRCTCTRAAARCRRSATWSISTTTCRIEHMLFDGALTPVDGGLHPDLSRPGLGLELKRPDADRYAV